MYHGYTGHEMMDEVGLIHMNGRLYDPVLGRFVSADFLIEDPSNLQSYNRYTYVWNNPLGSTDPSGQCGPICVAAWAFVGAEVAYQAGIIDKGLARAIQGISVAFALGPQFGAEGLISSGITSDVFASTLVAGAAGGFVSSDFSPEGAVQGAISAGLFYGAGSFAGTTMGGEGIWAHGGIGRVMAHAAAGCAGAMASGGSCGRGAMTAGLSEGIGGNLGEHDGVIARAVVGGTVSVIGGGKFANGAVMGAYGYLFNFLSHASFDRKTGVLDVQDGEKRATGRFFSGSGPDDQIAPGRYAVLDRGGKDGFRLEAIDSVFGDDMNGSGQSLLRLHGPGRSIGCVTACDTSNWNQVKNLIGSTAPREITVNTYKTFAIGGHLLFRWRTGTETLKYYGILEVK
jgi:RHS repeat-associated protein